MALPRAFQMITKITLFVALFSTLTVAKDVTTVEVTESVSVTMTHHSAASTMFNTQKDERQIQSFDLKAIIDGQHVMLGCRQLSKAFATETACDAIAPGKYSAEMKSHGKFVTVIFNEPLTGKEKKQTYIVEGSW